MNELFSFLITLRKTLIASGAPVLKIYHLQKLVMSVIYPPKECEEAIFAK